MDDLASALSNILSSKEGQEQLKNIQNMLGLKQEPPPPAPAEQPAPAAEGGFDLSALAGLFSGMKGGEAAPAPDAAPEENPLGGIDMNMILKLQQVFSSMNVNDKNSQLLMALKPHFGEKRQKRVDQAISMMRLFSMLPMLKESGIFAGL